MKSTDIKNHKTSISQTHNLEVLGSSPSWSTLILSDLRFRAQVAFLFCENILPQKSSKNSKMPTSL